MKNKKRKRKNADRGMGKKMNSSFNELEDLDVQSKNKTFKLHDSIPSQYTNKTQF